MVTEDATLGLDSIDVRLMRESVRFPTTGASAAKVAVGVGGSVPGIVWIKRRVSPLHKGSLGRQPC